jgi:hypothetical protein
MHLTPASKEAYMRRLREVLARPRIIAAVIAAALAVGTLAPAAFGQDVFSIIKTLGIGAAVRAFAPQINNFINTLLRNRGAAVQAQTKVVPVLSLTIGVSAPGGAYVGAAQVSGPAAAVNRVQAVALLEADYQTAFRIKVYVPVDNLKPWEAFRRVPGVGVSAIIDIRI